MLLKAMSRMHQNATLSEYDSNGTVHVEKLFLFGFILSEERRAANV